MTEREALRLVIHLVAEKYKEVTPPNKRNAAVVVEKALVIMKEHWPRIERMSESDALDFIINLIERGHGYERN